MKITLLVIGKTDSGYIEEGIKVYEKRLRKYAPFQLVVIPDIKNTKKMDLQTIKKLEGAQILEKLNAGAVPVLLDENGKTFSSVGFSGFIQKKMNAGFKELVFIIGGAYGFSGEIYKNCKEKVSLSEMTFSHQLVRLVFTEQLYRAFTILNNEPYHHN